MALPSKINLNGGKKLKKGLGHNYLQDRYKWLPKMPTEKKFIHPFTNKPTYFDYSKKLKDLVGDIIPYVAICKMLRVGMFSTHTSEYCEDFYTELVGDTYLKTMKSIGNWKPCYDILRFCQCMIAFGWLSLWSKYKEERKVIKGILDPNFHLSYQESLQLFETYMHNEEDDDKLCKLLEAQTQKESDEVDDINELVD